jgi:type IV pilus assembly protein PilB
MSALDTFLADLKRLLPTHAALLDQWHERHQSAPLEILRLLSERQFISHGRLCQLWADSMGVAYVNPLNIELPVDASVQLPAAVARRIGALVLTSAAGGVTVGMTDPANPALIASLRKALNREISPVFSHPDELAASFELIFSDDQRIASSLQDACASIPELPGGREIRGPQDAAELLDRAALDGLFNSILLTAFRRRASDIHLEIGPDEARVRFRIDGDMTSIATLPRPVHEALVVRIKVLCKLDITQSRLPQDGAFEIEFGGRRPAFRVASLPSLHGEKVVVRILGSPVGPAALPSISGLGMSLSSRAALKRVIMNPNGMLIVCGPTGSGKTTTLYACLAELKRPDLNLVTIEDPVEFRIGEISQHPVNASIGLGFSRILRSILRQDPDVILIGEIRDLETAQIATEAALTGHLVMTSLHANNSIEAVTRLIELGVEPYLVAPTTLGVISQRLVRRICPSCKESYVATRDELAPHFTNFEGDEVLLYRGRGCEKCHRTGFSGRVGLHEFMEVTPRLRDLIARGESGLVLQQEAQRSGYCSLRYDALKKALAGVTTLEEAVSATLPEPALAENDDAHPRRH